jgi:predicted O-linked N-acetylglucosamine transferase (SPINDLY family)
MSSAAIQSARAHFEAGRHAEARTALHAAMDEDPGNFEANYMMGIVLASLGDARAAIDAMRQAAAIDDAHAELQRNLGALLASQGNPEHALPCFRRAVELDPDNAGNRFFLGQALQQLGRNDEAVAAFEAALALAPERQDARFRLAVSEDRRGNQNAAAAALRQTIAQQPDHIDAAIRLADLTSRRGGFEEAARILQTALARKPDHAEARRQLGRILRLAGRKNDANREYRRAIELRPDHVDTQMEMGELLLEQRDPAGAVAAFRRALATQPDHAAALHRLYFGLASFCAWAEMAPIETAIDRMTAAALAAGETPIEPPFLNLIHCEDPERHRAIAAAWGRALALPANQAPAARPPAGVATRPRLRIGYLSYDFRNHAVAQLTCRLFELHDRQHFEIVAYSYGPDDGSALRKRIATGVDRFVDIGNDDYATAAARIAADGIDVLVDLGGHTMNSRLKIMAFRPAPVQATFLGFPGTSGCSFIDYLISDAIVTPPDHAAHYSEALCLLPDTFQPNDDRQPIAGLPVTRRDYGLPLDAPVFCSFNRPYKIEPVMFECWMRILAALPGSVLWLHDGPDALKDNLRDEASARGVAGQRIVFADRPDKAMHLRRLGLADLALDTRIYNGHTTTSDALWAGVPVVTMLGGHFASRVSASALRALGLDELVAQDLAQYEALAIRFGGDGDANLALRRRLQDRRRTAPLFDSARFTRHIEAAYRLMWARHAAGEKPAGFAVTP